MFSLDGYMKVDGTNKLQKFKPNMFGVQEMDRKIEGIFGFEGKQFCCVGISKMKDSSFEIEDKSNGELLNVITKWLVFDKLGGKFVLIEIRKNPDYKHNYIAIMNFIFENNRDSLEGKNVNYVLVEKNDHCHYYYLGKDNDFLKAAKKYMEDCAIYKTKEYKMFKKM